MAPLPVDWKLKPSSHWNVKRAEWAPMDAIRALLLDLDGTLLDTVPDLATAANRMLAELGLPARGDEAYASYVGKGIPMFVRRALAGALEGDVDEQLFTRALAIFERCYGDESGRRSRPYTGARRRGEVRGIRTPRRVRHEQERALHARAARTVRPLRRVRCGGVRRHAAHKKPDPAPLLHACERLGVPPAEALCIGDSDNDVGAARAAGCPVWCVPYGYNEGRPVTALACDRIVPTLAAAAELIAAARGAHGKIAGMETVELKVEGMDCQGCVKSVTRMLSGVAGVQDVDVSLEEGRARVTYDPARSGPAEFKRAIERAGYKAP
jgi:phosphoglycolate phosphatase